ncbi:hypothetical protein EMIT0P171_50186 [Pseudomonas sp. IT-P171]
MSDLKLLLYPPYQKPSLVLSNYNFGLLLNNQLIRLSYR